MSPLPADGPASSDDSPLAGKSNGFSLRKWYLDAFDDSGRGFVGYQLELAWRALRLRAAGLLSRSGEGESFASSTILEPGPIRSLADGLRWDEPRLDLELGWTSLAAPARRTLLDVPEEGRVDWRCELPAASVEGFLAGRSFSGLGYAEVVEISLRPWELPIDELRWGRFVSADDSVVWIDWSGARPVRLAWRSGCEAGLLARPEGTLVELEGGRLSWSATESIRRGPIGEKALASIRPWLPEAPRRLLEIDEEKWIARGTLVDSASGRNSEGWVVAEVVRWPAGANDHRAPASGGPR